MKTLAEFTRTTLIGGLLVILPVYVAVLLLAKTVQGLLGLLRPVAEQVPASVEFRQTVAILLLVCVCFLVGLIVRTGPGLRAKNACERAILEKLPGYTFLRGLAKRLAGRNGHAKVSFGTEGGLFQALGDVPAVVIGPGSIARAHKADEFVTLSELDACAAFVRRLIADSRAG